MKLTLRQTLASTAGATLAAIIASLFGVKGTIIGVAIGSAAATIGTALVARSIERGHDVVRQVVGTPEDPGVFRRLGDTGIVGAVTQANDETAVVETVSPSNVAPTEVVVPADEGSDGLDDTMAVPVPPSDPNPTATQHAPAHEADDPLEDIGIEQKAGGGYNIDWPLLVGTIGIVFVLTAICVTSIALITAYVTGNGVTNFVNPGTSSTTTPTMPPASTTTSSSSSTTTSTNATTTSNPEASTTTTIATTTTQPAPTTTTSAPTSVTTTTSSSGT